MQIHTITLETFKGVTGRFELDALNLLQGPNGSGKTAIIEAIRFAIEGAVSVGATADAVAKLAGPGGCGVAVELSTGFAWSRRLRIDHRKATMTTEIDIRGRGSLPIKEAEAVLSETVGAFAPMFDLAEFLDLSDDKRRDFVLGLCSRADAAKANPIQIMERIAWAFFAIKLGPGVVEVHRKNGGTLKALADELSAADRKALEYARTHLMPGIKGPTSDAVAAALQIAREIANSSKRQKDEAQAAGRQIAERRAAMRVPADSVAAMKGRIRELQSEREGISEQVGSQRGRLAARDSFVRSIESLNAAKAKSLESIAAAESASMASNITEAERLEAEAAAIAPKQSVEDAQSKFTHLDRIRDGIQDDIEATENRILVLEASPGDQHWLSAITVLSALEPFVAEDGKVHWTRLNNLAHARAGGPDKDAIAALRATLEEKEAALETADAAAREAHVNYDACRNAHNDHDRLMQDAARQRDAHDRRLLDLTGLRSEVGRQEAALIDAERRLNELDSAGGQIDAAALEDQAFNLATEIKRLELDIQSKQGFAALESEQSALLLKADEQEALHRVAKDLTAACKTVRETLMVDLVAPLVDPMNSLLAEFFGDQPGQDVRAYVSLENAKGRPIFELGMEVGNARIAYEALSGGERAILGVALAVSLVGLVDPPLKLLLVEAGEIDAEHGEQVLAGLQSNGMSMQCVVSHWARLVCGEPWNAIWMPIEGAKT
jgi:exonuclease SbcC